MPALKKYKQKKQVTFDISKTLNRARQIFLSDNMQLVYSFDLIVYMFLITYESIKTTIYYNILKFFN